MAFDNFVWDVVNQVMFLILSAVLVPFLLAKAAEAWGVYRMRQPVAADLLEQAAGFAVTAAEQIYSKEDFKAKKKYAIAIAEKWLAMNKIYIDLDMIDAAIEKAVREMKQTEALRDEDIY